MKNLFVKTALVLLWGGTIKKKELRKPCGILMLLGYAAYFVYLCVI